MSGQHNHAQGLSDHGGFISHEAESLNKFVVLFLYSILHNIWAVGNGSVHRVCPFSLFI